jgi:hypothetical protein
VRGRACSKRLDGLSSANDTRARSGLPWHRRVHFKRLSKSETTAKAHNQFETRTPLPGHTTKLAVLSSISLSAHAHADGLREYCNTLVYQSCSGIVRDGQPG